MNRAEQSPGRDRHIDGQLLLYKGAKVRQEQRVVFHQLLWKHLDIFLSKGGSSLNRALPFPHQGNTTHLSRSGPWGFQWLPSRGSSRSVVCGLFMISFVSFMSWTTWPCALCYNHIESLPVPHIWYVPPIPLQKMSSAWSWIFTCPAVWWGSLGTTATAASFFILMSPIRFIKPLDSTEVLALRGLISNLHRFQNSWAGAKFMRVVKINFLALMAFSVRL